MLTGANDDRTDEEQRRTAGDSEEDQECSHHDEYLIAKGVPRLNFEKTLRNRGKLLPGPLVNGKNIPKLERFESLPGKKITGKPILILEKNKSSDGVCNFEKIPFHRGVVTIWLGPAVVSCLLT